jgi:pimeloyl-ACP methyl ester carboxylesterase
MLLLRERARGDAIAAETGTDGPQQRPAAALLAPVHRVLYIEARQRSLAGQPRPEICAALALAYDSATLANFLHMISGPIVLVGHSYGGMVISNAATGDSQVKALVYDDASLPAQGDTLESLTTAGSCFATTDLSTVFNFVPFPGAPSGVADAYVKPGVFPGCFANGLPPATGAMLAATQRPLASSAFTDQSGVPAWLTIPSWDVIGTADHIVTPVEQLFMAHRAHAHITEVHAPHLSMISNPGVVARVEAAQSAG